MMLKLCRNVVLILNLLELIEFRLLMKGQDYLEQPRTVIVI